MSTPHRRNLVGKRNLHSYGAQRGFSQIEKGVSEIIENELVALITVATRDAILQADLENKKTLNYKRAAAAVDHMQVIPSGHYQ